MAKASAANTQSKPENQTDLPIIETASGSIPEIPEIAPPPPPEPPPVKAPEPPVEVKPVYQKEMDITLSHGVRILAFLEKMDTGEFIKLNDFLKSLYPLAKPGFPPGFTNPENMRFLKMTLKQMQTDGRIAFANNSFERLGKHYYDEQKPETRYHNALTLPIEAKIPQ